MQYGIIAVVLAGLTAYRAFFNPETSVWQARHTAPVDALTDDDHESVVSSKQELSGTGTAHSSLPQPSDLVRDMHTVAQSWLPRPSPQVALPDWNCVCALCSTTPRSCTT